MTRAEQIFHTLCPEARTALINTRARMYSPVPAGTTDDVLTQLIRYSCVTDNDRITEVGLAVRGVALENALDGLG